ncbi:putative transcriptional regulator [Bacillus sp. TS-2]|nr:putative transcriptional regulator [Bacillus sp. TS-2]
MSVSMKDVLQEPLLKDAKVISGKGEETAVNVQWISVIELPVENFVRKNEVVLTTAIGCKSNPELFIDFVHDVIKSEAAGLMVALGRFLFDIPQQAIELANKHDFMIITIPWEVRFANIVETVMKELSNQSNKDREYSEKIQQELLYFILAERKLKEILHYIEKHVEAPVFLTDQNGNLKESHHYSEIFLNKWKQDVVKGFLPKKQVTKQNHDPLIQKFEKISKEGQLLLQIPILKVSGEPQGYIYVDIPKAYSVESFLISRRVHVLEHAATSIALWLSRENAIEETELRLRSDFVAELARGYISKYEQAVSRSQILGYQLQIPYVCILCFPEGLDILYDKKRQKEHYSQEQWKNSMFRYIEEELFFAGKTLERQLMITREGDKLIIYLEIQHQTEHEYATDFLDHVDRRMRHLIPEISITWGIGRRIATFKHYHESYQQANRSLKIGRSKGTRRTWYEQTKLDRVLLQLLEKEEMREIVIETIEPLVHYDEERQMDLIGTFIAFNQFRGNVSQTARSLNLHRQSLLYRLRKIETLTQLSLNNPEHLFLLDLSIKAWKLGLHQ